jgi:hypothetical protein
MRKSMEISKAQQFAAAETQRQLSSKVSMQVMHRSLIKNKKMIYMNYLLFYFKAACHAAEMQRNLRSDAPILNKKIKK